MSTSVAGVTAESTPKIWMKRHRAMAMEKDNFMLGAGGGNSEGSALQAE